MKLVETSNLQRGKEKPNGKKRDEIGTRTWYRESRVKLAQIEKG